SQSLSWPSIHRALVFSVPVFEQRQLLPLHVQLPPTPQTRPLQPESAQSMEPLQLLSAPSLQSADVSSTLLGQAQAPPAVHWKPFDPQLTPVQLVSMQSISPSQSLSTPSVQRATVFSIPGPGHAQLALPLQSESAQSVKPSQSLS